MKKMMKTLVLVAASAMGMTACQNDIDEQIEVKDSVTIEFIADSAESRTSVDTSGDAPVFAWDEQETFAVLEQTDALAAATEVTYEKEDGKAKITATFPTNADKSEYNYVTVYPAGGYVSAESITVATLSLPAEQTMAEGSFDPKADLMVSEVVTINGQPTEAQYLRFTRLAAVAKMTVKGVTGNVESVIFTAEGKNIAGTITTDLNNPHDFTVKEGVSSVTVTASANEVYFTTLPFTLATEETYTVTVITDKYIYVKNGTIPAEKSLAFESGMVTRFGVDMSTVTPSEKWVLVKDASTLKSGDVVTIAAASKNYVIGAKWASSYPYASYTEIIKFGDYLYHPIATAETSVDYRIQHLTIGKPNNEVSAFHLYNDVDYEGDTYSGYLYAPSSASNLKLQAYPDNNSLFYIEVNDGVASIIAKDGSYNYKQFSYYNANYASSRKFYCIKESDMTDAKAVCVYRLEGAQGTIPVAQANVTVPDEDEYVTIAEEGAATATAIEEVVFNYVGDWNIAVSEEADWLTVSYADGKVSYTAEANTGAKREATVTITATLEGQEALTWAFNILQKGAPVEVTIAEFITKEKDVNTTYKITGKITETATNSSTAYKLTDGNGNVAQIKYLQTEEGVSVWGHDELELKVGDVVTVTTVVASNTKGQGGHTSYPSIYKGHYGITAKAGLAAEYTGGDVAITVETYSNGHIETPTEIVGAWETYDYATISYDGGATATVTFTSENETSYAREATATFIYGLASATATAQQGINPANKLGYELVTDASTLAVGDEVIIVALDANANKALGVSTSTITSQTTFPGVNIVKSGNVIYDAVEAGVQTFTLADCNAEGKFAFNFTHKETNYNLYVASKLQGNTSTTSSFIKLSVSIDSESYAATIQNSSTSTIAFVSFNATSGNFGIVKTTADNTVAIYRMQK